MSEAFVRAFNHTLGHEGGYQADERDRGNWTGGDIGKGELRGTKWGISAASYPYLDIEALTTIQARQIYLRDYWRRIRGDDLPAGLALFLFDYAVNSGVARAAMALQRIIDVSDDGVIGPITLARVKAYNAAALVERLHREREAFYRSLSTFEVYGNGWLARNRGARDEALAMFRDEQQAARLKST